MTANYHYSGGPWTTKPNSGQRSIGDVLESERRLAEENRQLRDKCAAVRDVCQTVWNAPDDDKILRGKFGSLEVVRRVLDALDGDDSAGR